MASLVLLAAIICAPLLVLYARSRRRGTHPPGPTGLPFVGNLRDIPSGDERGAQKYESLCQAYNTNILHLHVFGTNLIILNTLEAAKELLDRRSSIYSDRPRMLMVNELAGFGWNFGTQDYNDDWRACRKMSRHEFHGATFKKYRPVLAKHAQELVRRLGREHGDRLPVHLKHMVGANIMEIAYDIKVLPENDPFITLAEAAQQCVSRGVSGTYLVDLLPILRYVPAWLPGAGFQRDAAVWHKAADKHLHIAYDDFLLRLREGKAGDCLARSLIDEYGTEPATDRHARMTTATMYMGGSETVAAALHTLLFILSKHPDVQARAQRELEAVIGTRRLPTFDDLGAIPYIDALIMEVQRRYPIIPLNIPHKLHSDDVYKGYLLDKGSLVFVNNMAILHNPKTYPGTDPLAFDPTRFLAADGTLTEGVLDPFDIVFGYGRRVCPGQHMARDALWISVACILACLDVAPAKDTAGKPIEDEDFVNAFVVEPKPFQCELRFRSEAHAALLGGR